MIKIIQLIHNVTDIEPQRPLQSLLRIKKVKVIKTPIKDQNYSTDRNGNTGKQKLNVHFQPKLEYTLKLNAHNFEYLVPEMEKFKVDKLFQKWRMVFKNTMPTN